MFTAESTCALEALEVFCSPSGQLVFSRPTDGQAYRVGANGTGLTRLTTSATIGESDRVGDFAWSPDGRRIAFTASHPGVGLGDIDLMDADGSHVVRRLRDFLRTMRDPPPGRRTGRRSPSYTLIAMRDMKRST